MAQFQAQVPHPWANDLPYPLFRKRYDYTNESFVLFQVLIGQGVFKSATMQVEGHHIDSRKGPPLANRSRRVPRRRRSGSHRPDSSSLWPDGSRSRPGRVLGDRAESQARAVVEGAADPAFGMREVLVCWQVQTSLHVRSLQDLIVFATHDIGQSCQVGEDGSRAILPIQARA